MRVAGIVPAAGTGERLGSGGPKAFAPCGGRPLAARSVEVLAAACDLVVVALPSASPSAEGLVDVALPVPLVTVQGGPSRSESVKMALAAAGEDLEIAVVHDAARPLVTRDLVERCVAALDEGWEGAIAAAPVTDTVKQVAADGVEVERTLERSRLWAVETPQAFRAEALREALAVGPEQLAAATDDASLVEAAGGRVRVVESLEENLKVTRPADLERAEALLAARAAA